MRDISIVIPTWNGRALLSEYLPSVIAAANQYRDEHRQQVEIIVVDDGSSDNTASWIVENFAENFSEDSRDSSQKRFEKNPDKRSEASSQTDTSVRMISLQSNSGFVAAANAGFASARFPLILLLNNDVRIERDAIAPLAAHFDDARVFAVCARAMRLGTNHLDGGGKLGLFERGFWRVYLNYDVISDTDPTGERWRSFFGSGGYTAYDASKLKELGGFNELLAPAFWEDVEICYRAWKRGWIVEYEPASLVHHVSSATMQKDELRTRMKVVSERNRLLVTWIHVQSRAWLASHLFWLSLKSLGAALTLNKIFLSALVQAIRLLPQVRAKRREEQAASVRTDGEIESIFRSIAANNRVRVLRNVRDSSSRNSDH